MQLKSSLLFAAAALSAVTKASHWRHGALDHHHRRRDNMTDSGLTTAVVYTTSVHTVTSCASTISSCPADSVVLVTSTVVAYTTICPVAEASNYGPPAATSPSSTGAPVVPGSNTAIGAVATSPSSSSSWSVPYSVPYSLPGTGYAPIPTPQGPAPQGSGQGAGNSPGSLVLTYTLGSGTSTTVVTTTVMTSTTTETLYLHSVYPSTTNAGAVPSESGITTLHSTSTQINVVVVPASSGTSSPGSVQGSGGCPSAGTVTVTAEQPTITVTVTNTPSAQAEAVSPSPNAGSMLAAASSYSSTSSSSPSNMPIYSIPTNGTSKCNGSVGFGTPTSLATMTLDTSATAVGVYKRLHI